MHLVEHIHSDVVILEPREPLTMDNERELRQVARRHVEAGRTRLLLDLAQVTHIDSCGLGTIAQIHLTSTRAGGWLRLHNVSGRNLQLLTVTRLIEFIGVYAPRDEAATA